MKNIKYKKNVSWLVFFNYTNIALAFASNIILVPLYLKLIQQDIYGYWLATGNILVWLTVVDPGLSTVIQQKVAVAFSKDDNVQLNSIISSGLFISLLIALSITVLGQLAAPGVSNIVGINKNIEANYDIIVAFKFASIGSALMIFSYSINAVLLGLQESTSIGVIGLLGEMGGLLFMLLLLFQGYGVFSLAIKQLVSGTILIMLNIINIIIVYKKYDYKFHLIFDNIKELVSLLSFSFLGRLSGIVSNKVDLIIVSRFVGSDTVIALNMTRKIPEFFRMLIERPLTAIMPSIAHLYGSGSKEKVKKTVLNASYIVLWSVGLFGAGFIFLNGSFINLWIGKNYYLGDSLNSIIIITIIGAIIRGFLSLFTYSLGNIKGNNIASLANSIAYVTILLIAVNNVGMVGIIIAPLAAFVITGFWYFPLKLSKMLNFSRNEIGRITLEIGIVICVFITITILKHYMQFNIAESWIEFALAATTIASIYLILLFSYSTRFRKIIISLSMK